MLPGSQCCSCFLPTEVTFGRGMDESWWGWGEEREYLCVPFTCTVEVGAAGQRGKEARGPNWERWGLKPTAGHTGSPEAFGAS